MESPPEGAAPAGHPWYKHKWVKVVGLALASLSIIAAMTITVLFVQWNGRPEKAMFDAIDYALKQPGVYHVTSKDMDITVQVDGEQYAVDAKVDSVPVYLVGKGDILYLKTPQPQQLIEKIVPESSLNSIRPVIGGVVESAKDKWLRVNLSNQSMSFAIFDQLGCATTAKDVMADDKNTRGAVASTYLAHPFFDFNLKTQESSRNVYTLTIDEQQRQQFRSALTKTRAAQTLSDCMDTPVPVLENLKVTSLDMDIARPIHRFNSIALETKSGGLATVKADYDTQPKITIPTDTVELNQIVGSVFSMIMQTYFKGR